MLDTNLKKKGHQHNRIVKSIHVFCILQKKISFTLTCVIIKALDAKPPKQTKFCIFLIKSDQILFRRRPSGDVPGSRSSWQRYCEVLRVTTTTRCLRTSSLLGIWKVRCVLEMRQYCWTTGWTVFTQRFLKYTLDGRKRKGCRGVAGLEVGGGNVRQSRWKI